MIGLVALSVDIRYDIVQRATDGDEVGDFCAFRYVVDHCGQRQAGGSNLQAVRFCGAVAFEVYAEYAAAAFYHREPVANRQFEYLRDFYEVFAIGDVVYELCQDACRLFHFEHACLEACHGVSFGEHYLVEVEFAIYAVGTELAHVACPTGSPS